MYKRHILTLLFVAYYINYWELYGIFY